MKKEEKNINEKSSLAGKGKRGKWGKGRGLIWAPCSKHQTGSGWRMERLSPSAANLSVGCSSAAQQDDDVDEEQADQDEGEVDEQLLQVPLGLRVHLNLRRPADSRLGHVLDALHGDGLDCGWHGNGGGEGT